MQILHLTPKIYTYGIGLELLLQFTYGIGDSVEESSAMYDSEMLVVSDDEEAPGSQARFCSLFQLSQLY